MYAVYDKNNTGDMLTSIRIPDYSTIGRYDHMPEHWQLNHVTEVWHNIGDITEPSEKVQLAAVNASPLSISFIGNPTNTVLDIIISDEYMMIEWPNLYEGRVKKRYRDNTVMVNKWLRYAENIRSL
jgi:hypothetical protein